MSDTPPPQPPTQRRGRWVAIVTGAISVLVGLLYLVLIVVLDSRGPLQPPPPEALGLSAAPVEPGGAGGAAGDPAAAAAPPPG
jgi:hypothetical protein